MDEVRVKVDPIEVRPIQIQLEVLRIWHHVIVEIRDERKKGKKDD